MRAWAVIPAAGLSKRMGQPKLMLPWQDATLIDTVLHAWCSSRVNGIVVVIRSGDSELRDRCLAHGVTVVQPQRDPAEMRESIQLGLAYLLGSQSPAADDRWLVAPADMPGLSSALINSVLEGGVRAPGSVIIPTWRGRRGHPVLLPWQLASALEQLETGRGLRDLIAHQPIVELSVSDAEACVDVDTPAEWEAFQNRHRG